MDSLVTVLLILAGAAGAVLVPLVLHVWHLRNTRQLREAIRSLALRVAVLEQKGAQAVEPQTAPPVRTEVAAGVPPPLPVAAAAPRPRSGLDVENVVGVKLFAWMGGLALFIGLAFAMKYAFENNLITPSLRVLGGACIGAALVASGLAMARRGFRAPAFSLCATGVLVLYSAAYAAHAFYGLVPLWVSTAAMIAVTAGALLLAVRLDAQVIVVLGILGGFLTPALLWPGGNRPVPLFAYVAVLNLGTAIVAIHKRWSWMVALAAAATVVTEFVWLIEFLDAETASSARWVFLLFLAQFGAIAFMRQRLAPAENWTTIATAIAGFAGIAAAGVFANAADAVVTRASFVLPFLLLCNTGLLLVVLARRSAGAGVARDSIAAIPLLLTWAVEFGWHEDHFSAGNAGAPLVWYVAIFALFVAFPYFAPRPERSPWTIAAVAGPLQFWLVYRGVTAAYPSLANGLLPAAFALPYLFGVWFLTKRRGVTLASADQRLVSQSTAALLFLSLVVAVQFRREWITIGWALEGVALLLLYRRIPSPQLRWTAVVVLCAAFGRLALNPAVWEYHPRSSVPIWNWYLYAYGITAVCLLAAARLLTGRDKIPARLLYTLGTITAFLLLNIEIADYFSVGSTLTFSFTGNFARDMTYSIAWALFAFALVLIGMRQKARSARYAGIALLLFTLAKLFLHDFANLGPLYRIGAFIGVALILIVASFVYQRFLAPAAGERDAAA